MQSLRKFGELNVPSSRHTLLACDFVKRMEQRSNTHWYAFDQVTVSPFECRWIILAKALLIAKGWYLTRLCVCILQRRWGTAVDNVPWCPETCAQRIAMQICKMKIIKHSDEKTEDNSHFVKIGVHSKWQNVAEQRFTIELISRICDLHCRPIWLARHWAVGFEQIRNKRLCDDLHWRW